MIGPRNTRSMRMALARKWPWLFLTLVLFAGSVLQGQDKEGEKKPAPEAPADTPEAKILQDLFRQMFAPRKNNGRPRDGRPLLSRDKSDDLDGDSLRDPIDSRAPRNTKADQLLQAAQTAVRQKNWKSAVDLFQRLLDQPEDSLHRTESGKWQSMRQTVNESFSQLPEATLVEYRSQYGGLANQLLMDARRSGQTADLVSVAIRFFHTPAGYEAANILASQHFDRSEFELAARWFSELAASPALIARQDPWLLQAALALSRAGDTAGANALLSRLSQGPATVVSLGTGTVKAAEWLSKIQGDVVSGVPSLTEWTQIYGTAARVGTAVGGDALLSPNWTLPLTSSHSVSNSLKWLIHDLQDQQRALILAAQPLVIDGKVIYRDLRGLRSVDIELGRTIWEGVEGISPERILGGLPSQQLDPQDAWRLPMNPFQNLGEYQGMSAEYSPLTSLLFRDGTYGLISSDGKQLFVIEDHGILSSKQPGQHWGWDGSAESHDPFGVPWKTNRLVSYDLRTGRTLWSVGGNESRESFDLPLAGSYIYGTPTVDGNDLFLVAGKGDDIRLWSLDRRTGNPQWSQLIAYADTKIDVDIARRWITSQVAVGSGVIVCPTTVGWLVAIDRMRQSVLWAHRYSPRTAPNSPERETASTLLAQRELNGLWCPSAPVIAGNHVIFTPQEEPLLVCLNVVDGQRIWEKPKERGLYLAGVFDQIVLIVGEDGVTAFQLSDGQTLWTTKLEEGIRPSGRGVVVDRHFYLPLSNGELQAIGLAMGEILSQTYVGTAQPSLGNLAMHRGKLVSLNPTGLTVFGQRDAVIAEIDQRLAKNPEDAWALLRSSEIQLLNHNYSEAMSLLRRISVDQLTPAERVRQHVALVECLSTLIHGDILHRSDELVELEQLATSAPEKLLYHELSAEKLLAENKPVEAFDIFIKLAEEAGGEVVVRSDDRHISVRRAAWLSGRIFEIWSAASEVDRRLIDERIETISAKAAERSADDCQRVVTLFAFHPVAIKSRQRFVEWLVAAKDFSGARLELQKLVEHSDSAVAARAIDRLARLMIQLKLPADASYYYRQIESRFGDIIVRDGLAGTALVAQVRAAKEVDLDPGFYGVLWKASQLKLEQSVMNYSLPSQDVVHETSLPFFHRRSLEFYQNEQRMALESVETGQVDWTIPLRGAVRAADDGFLSTSHIGHQLYFVNRGVLHAISPIESRIIWSKSLDSHLDGNGQVRHDSRPPMTPMFTPGNDLGSQSLLSQRASSTGYLAVVQPNYLCIYGRRALSILDPRTGDELWNLDGMPPNAQVFGNRDTLFLIVPGKSEALAYRVLDGKPIEVSGVVKVLSNAMLAHGSSFLLFEQAGTNPLEVLGIRRPKTSKRLRLYDPVLQVTQWELELPAGTQVSPLGQEEVVAAQADGQVMRIDVATGHVTSLEAIPPEAAAMKKSKPVREKYLLADDDRIYLIINTLDDSNLSYGESLASIRVHGTIVAWSRKDNRFLWKRAVERQNLVVDRFSTIPVLLFVSRSWKPRPRMDTGSLHITAIHKQSGQLLTDKKIPSIYSGFHAVSINAEEPSIELKSYNARLRLIPEDGLGPGAADSSAPDSKASDSRAP